MYLKKSHTNDTNVEAFLSRRDYSNLVCTGRIFFVLGVKED